MTDARLLSQHRSHLARLEASSEDMDTITQEWAWPKVRLAEAADKLVLRDTRIADLVTALERESKARQELLQEREIHDEEIAQLTRRAHWAETELETIRPERDRLASERDALRNEVAALASERDALRNEVAALAGERDALRNEVAALAGERDALHASYSWRVTAPVRYVSLRLRGHRR